MVVAPCGWVSSVSRVRMCVVYYRWVKEGVVKVRRGNSLGVLSKGVQGVLRRMPMWRMLLWLLLLLLQDRHCWRCGRGRFLRVGLENVLGVGIG